MLRCPDVRLRPTKYSYRVLPDASTAKCHPLGNLMKVFSSQAVLYVGAVYNAHRLD